MKEIKMPQFDVNDNMVTITELFVQDGVYVNKGDRILKAESTKMVRDVVAEVSGYLRWNVKCFETKTNGAVIAYLFDSKEDCDNFTVAQSTNCGEEVPANATAKAIALAKQLNIDINEVAKEKGEGIIKTSDVEKFSLKKGKNTSIRNTNYSVPTMINTFDRERVIIIGAGRMSEQIMDILLDDKDKCVVGVVDSYKTEYASYPLPLYTCDVYEFPDKIDRSFYDTVIISFGGDKKAMQFRKELYENYKQKDMKFTNAIGDNVNIRRAVSIGENNVIMHNCFIGTGAQIGNNNILSYGSYIGHHCVIGSHNLFAPGFVTPGSVRVGDDNIIMTGVQTINYVSIGNNTVLPVGYNVVNDIPDGTNLLNTNGGK